MLWNLKALGILLKVGSKTQEEYQNSVVFCSSSRKEIANIFPHSHTLNIHNTRVHTHMQTQNTQTFNRTFFNLSSGLLFLKDDSTCFLLNSRRSFLAPISPLFYIKVVIMRKFALVNQWLTLTLISKRKNRIREALRRSHFIIIFFALPLL